MANESALEQPLPLEYGKRRLAGIGDEHHIGDIEGIAIIRLEIAAVCIRAPDRRRDIDPSDL